MKIMNEVLRDKSDMFNPLTDIGFRGKKALLSVKFVNNIHREAHDIQTVRDNLIKKYGTKKEDGSLVVDREINRENHAKFHEEYQEIAKEFTEINPGFTITDDEIETLNLTTEQIKLCILTGIYTLDEDEKDEIE